jgi:hypothetical protein
MSKTLRAEHTDHEIAGFPVPDRALRNQCAEPFPGLANDPPERWSAERLRGEYRRSLREPMRTRGGIPDHGVASGTIEGAHRYYFSAHRGPTILLGTLIANRRTDVARYIREELRGVEPIIGRDVLILRGVLASM